MFVFCVYIYKPPAGVVAPKYPERTTKKEIPPETMDEAMDDDTKDPGPFQQRSDPAAEPEDAVAESMDETMDGDSRPQPTRLPSRALCLKGPITNAPTTTHKPPQPQLTKTQKKRRQLIRKRQTQAQTQAYHQDDGSGGEVSA